MSTVTSVDSTSNSDLYQHIVQKFGADTAERWKSGGQLPTEVAQKVQAEAGQWAITRFQRQQEAAKSDAARRTVATGEKKDGPSTAPPPSTVQSGLEGLIPFDASVPKPHDGKGGILSEKDVQAIAKNESHPLRKTLADQGFRFVDGKPYVVGESRAVADAQKLGLDPNNPDGQKQLAGHTLMQLEQLQQMFPGHSLESMGVAGGTKLFADLQKMVGISAGAATGAAAGLNTAGTPGSTAASVASATKAGVSSGATAGTQAAGQTAGTFLTSAGSVLTSGGAGVAALGAGAAVAGVGAVGAGVASMFGFQGPAFTIKSVANGFADIAKDDYMMGIINNPGVSIEYLLAMFMGYMSDKYEWKLREKMEEVVMAEQRQRKRETMERIAGGLGSLGSAAGAFGGWGRLIGGAVAGGARFLTTAANAVEAATGGVQKSTTLLMAEVQFITQQWKTMMEMSSNLLKLLHDMAMTPIRNYR